MSGGTNSLPTSRCRLIDGRRLAIDAAWVILLTAMGVGLGMAARRDIGVTPHVVSAWSIFTHNFGLAVIMCAATKYVAYPAIALNCFVNGVIMGVYVIHRDVISLVGSMVWYSPLEVIGWLSTLQASVRTLDLYRSILSGEGIRQEWQRVFRWLLILLVVYAMAAVLEQHGAMRGAR